MRNHKNSKMFLLSLALLFSFNFICLAQNNADSTLIPFSTEEKWGYINNKGKIVIKPQFDEAYKFSEGLARVQIGLKSGFIDSSGKFVIEPIYTFAFSFSEGLAVVGKDMDSRWFYIDNKGETIIKPSFEFIWLGPFKNGLAQFSTNVGGNTTDTYDARSGFIDRSGKIIIEPKFTVAENFSESLAIIADDKPNKNNQAYFNKKAFIDTKGNVVTPFFDVAESFSEGLAVVVINKLHGYIDKTGNLVIPPKFDFASDFSKGFAVYGCENDKFGFIDRKGNEVTDCVFKNVHDFSDGLAPVQVENKKWGFIDSNGNFVVKPQFDYAESFYNGLAEVKIKKDGWIYMGFINHKGKFVFKPVKLEKLEESNNEPIEIE